jgi:ATP-dependent exoDNAse (exonuclease V) beta subunit
MQISESIKDFYISHYKTYYTCRLIKKQINYAALIDKSLQIVHKNLFESGKFLISEVPVFLSEIATQNSSSFIFEKTGSFYENYLIDEFQDTSRIQWDSFKPLLSESLSVGSPEQINSIVGDLKQSIYSWRGGDWRLLAIDIKKEFEKFYKEIALQNNWRSGEEIVSFNNNFFDIASGVLRDDINDAIPPEYHNNTGDLIPSTIYSNIEQNVKKDFASSVKIDLFKSKEDGESDIIKNLIAQIEDLQQKNYQPGEIMILVRKNKDGSKIAEEIIKHAQSENAKPGVVYDVISSEALLISSNKSIKLLISCFKYLSENDDDIAFYEAAYSYYVHKNLKNNEKIVFNKDEFAQFLNNALSSIKQSFNHRLLHETCDSLIKILELNLDEENIPFLNSFRDLLHEYSLNNPAEVTKFLEYWEEKGQNQNLRIPEKQNAINIITIHKSKGLAADFVFVPFVNWELKRHGNTIWVSPEIEPFNALPIWPTKADKFLENSIFEKDFHESNFKLSVEAFNMLYVAFTRARKGLFISTTTETCDKKNTIAGILNNSLLRLSQNKPSFFNIDENDERISYKLGDIPVVESNYTIPDYIKSYKIFVPEKKITIRPFYEKNSHDSQSDSNIIEGIKMHKIYENIEHYADLDKALLKLNSIGIINSDDIDIYKRRISETLNHEFIKSWFDGSYTIYNEAEIASSKGEIRRPDRIMQKDDEIIIVDYKFGDIEKSQYINQTKYYAQLLSELGHKNIKTYIWFVMHDYLLEVNTSDNHTKKIILNK